MLFPNIEFKEQKVRQFYWSTYPPSLIQVTLVQNLEESPKQLIYYILLPCSVLLSCGLTEYYCPSRPGFLFSVRYCACVLEYQELILTHRKDPDLSLQGANLLEVCAVVVVTIQLWQLTAIPNVSCKNSDACQVCMQLRAKDHDALLWNSLQTKICVKWLDAQWHS